MKPTDDWKWFSFALIAVIVVLLTYIVMLQP